LAINEVMADVKDFLTVGAPKMETIAVNLSFAPSPSPSEPLAFWKSATAGWDKNKNSHSERPKQRTN
jgi:hypothetical protein